MVKIYTHTVIMESDGFSIAVADCANGVIADSILKTLLENADPTWEAVEMSPVFYRMLSHNERKVDFRVIPYQR